MERRAKVELFEQIRKEYELGLERSGEWRTAWGSIGEWCVRPCRGGSPGSSPLLKAFQGYQQTAFRKQLILALVLRIELQSYNHRLHSLHSHIFFSGPITACTAWPGHESPSSGFPSIVRTPAADHQLEHHC